MTPETMPRLVPLTPFQLFITGCRMVGDYDMACAVEDYVSLHPGADPAVVQAAIEAGIADPSLFYE